MIGVAADPQDLEVAAEFFELFKIPWEPAQPSRRYAFVIGSNVDVTGLAADFLVLYGSGEQRADRDAGVAVRTIRGATELQWDLWNVPIYGGLATFDRPIERLTSHGRSIDYSLGGRVRRIGYDLFGEVRRLLGDGQPPSSALVPTLDLHIGLLRSILVECGAPFVEIPPRPAGYDFICCLTHDIDFCGIRRHRADRTLAGFVIRASIGTIGDLARGRRSLAQAARNWLALFSMPFVFAGLLPDFWRPFEDYARADGGRRSTFFVVPFKGRPGVGPDGRIARHRAVKYQASEVREELSEAARRGSEIALHGIDAWRDGDAGRAERAEIESAGVGRPLGVRMHWLYFGADSPRALENGGFSYDSTYGYNESVGYRAGTSQAFLLPGTQNMMELPLTIMDSALFYSGRLHLSPDEAARRCRVIAANARTSGGAVVINWHDRSLAAERLWDRFYRDLLADIEEVGRPWYATCSQAVDWFRWRRSVRFAQEPGTRRVTVHAEPVASDLPGGVVRVQRAGSPGGTREDLLIDGRQAITVEL